MEDLRLFLFYLGVAGIFAHELDAIQQHEWRFFFPHFTDQTGYRLFTALHVPLFGFVLWGLPFREFQIGMDVFLMVHVGLHWLLRNHPKIEFRNPFSRLLIGGTGFIGLAHLGLLLFFAG